MKKNNDAAYNSAANTQNLLEELLRPMLAQAIQDALSNMPAPVAPDNDLLTVDSAAKYLSVSKDYIYRKTCANEIPFHKKGKRNYFSKQELSDWLKS
jgi:excisionase family DNA binding protein